MWVRILLLSILIALLLQRSLSVRPKKKVRASRATPTELERSSAQTRSRDEWRAMSREALKLACLNFHIVDTGNRQVLAERLFAFFNPDISGPGAQEVLHPSPPPPPTTNNNNSTTSSMASAGTNNSTLPVNRMSNTNASAFPDLGQVIRQEISKFFATANVSNIVASATASALNPIGDQQQILCGATAANFTTERNDRPVMPTSTMARSRREPPLSNMPALPQAVIDKISNGEFVNFDLLLPNRSPILTDEYSFKVVGGSTPSVSLIPKNQHKPKVTDFGSWMVAWTNFLRCYMLFFPQRIHELIRYQALITDFASQYTFSAWSLYDRTFRYQLAFNQELSWHIVDDDLYNRYLRGSTTQNVCYNCRSFGHFSSACPARTGIQGSLGESSQPFRSSQQRVGTPANGPEFRNTRTCHFYNNNGQCNSEKCRFLHECRVCHGAHPGFQCPKRFSS